LLGAPVQEGSGRYGCELAPKALRDAGLGQVIKALGHSLIDRGDLVSGAMHYSTHGNLAIKELPEVVAWSENIADAVYEASAEGMPITIGGDHSIAAGTLPALSRRAAEQGRKLFVLWLDAHPDFHTLETTQSGNLHGVPLAYAAGREGFGDYFPPLSNPIDPARICMMGIRSIDPAESKALAAAHVTVHEMSAIENEGVEILLDAFLQRVERENGILHVSLDVDFLDPESAPGVGTPVANGPRLPDVYRMMRMLHDSGRVGSLDIAELNPLLDEDGRTARLLVDIVATVIGRPISSIASGSTVA
jgi:arginase